MSTPISPEHPVMVVVGTRPEVIKLAPVALELARREVPSYLLSSGQHRQLLDPMLELFALTPDADLAVMQPGQGLAALSAALLTPADRLLEEVSPSWVVVQGDTTTVAMIALAAFYRQIAVAHVEAGLRTHQKYDPFPEEMNRTLLGPLADLHFAPTAGARQNLLRQGVPAGSVEVVGNTVIDALYQVRRQVEGKPLSDFGLELPAGRKLVLVTGHRRENFGPGFEEIFTGLRRLAEELSEEATVLYPVHLNPRVRDVARQRLAGLPNLRLVEPLSYPAFVRAMLAAHLIVTDSGGVQEEATSLGVPVLVTRRTSERPEALESGVAELVGTDASRLVDAARRLLTDPAAHARRAVPSAVFGDGRAAQRIVDRLTASPPPSFTRNSNAG